MKISRTLAALLLAAFVGDAVLGQASPYQSDEFSSGDSRMPVLFACMFAGTHSELAPDADQLGLDMLLSTGATPKQIDQWIDDAAIYVSQELKGLDMSSYWEVMCDEPFRRMREVFGN